MFSPADYELAARVLGLPLPTTKAEIAAATPMTARVVRDFARMRPPLAGDDADGIYTGATRSLNSMPDTTQPMEKAHLAARLRTEVESPHDDEYLVSLLVELTKDPDMVEALIELLTYLAGQSDEHMDMLSSQRPAEFDTPNMGANYSMLNAPSSNGIEPSRAFQPLS